MDSLPIKAIERIESELLKRVLDIYELQSDTLFFDTTNFFRFFKVLSG